MAASPLSRAPAATSAHPELVVVGASAGGVAALLKLSSALPAPFPAPILVVLHIGANTSVLPMLLSAHGNNRAVHAQDGQALEKGTIYVAPPDHHMLVHDGRIRLNRGPKEHHTRPAIDPLFRSAALAHGPHVVGVVLTGRLDDGTAGLKAIKQCGGVTVVQDPAEAEHPGMPRSALQTVAVDHCLPLEGIAAHLHRLVTASAPPVKASTPAAADLAHEVAVFDGQGDPMENLRAIGKPSTLACPDCAGVLWEIEDMEPPRYRCHTGHAFSLRSLEDTQSATTEDALWGAVRALQQREVILRRLAEHERKVGAGGDADRYEAQADEAARHAELLHGLVVQG